MLSADFWHVAGWILALLTSTYLGVWVGGIFGRAQAADDLEEKMLGKETYDLMQKTRKDPTWAACEIIRLKAALEHLEGEV